MARHIVSATCSVSREGWTRANVTRPKRMLVHSHMGAALGNATFKKWFWSAQLKKTEWIYATPEVFIDRQSGPSYDMTTLVSPEPIE